nr:MAG TPA: hypothetical protein [Caudoviricetes sp.]
MPQASRGKPSNIQHSLQVAVLVGVSQYTSVLIRKEVCYMDKWITLFIFGLKCLTLLLEIVKFVLATST